MLVVAVVGPESTGKSTLAAQLATTLRCPLVPEYARAWLDRHGPGYDHAGYLAMARGQHAAEQAARAAAPDQLVLDTDLLVTRVWGDDKFGAAPHWLETTLLGNRHHYLLCAADLPWVADPQREDPERGGELQATYQRLLERLGLPWALVTGQGAARLASARAAIQRWQGAAPG